MRKNSIAAFFALTPLHTKTARRRCEKNDWVRARKNAPQSAEIFYLLWAAKNVEINS